MTENEENERHIRTILMSGGPFAELASDMRMYARGFPSELSTTFQRYADNLEACQRQYEFPIMIYTRWMAERARALRPSLTAEEAGRELAPRFLDFVENRSEGLKDAARAHSRMMYVSLWSVYDAFIGDLVRSLANEIPEMFQSKEAYKKIKEATNHMSIVQATVKGTSLRLGDLIFSDRTSPPHSKLRAILEDADRLKHSKKVCEALSSSELRLLEKRRHLVAHNAGVIDEKYISETSCREDVGKTIEASPADIMRGLSAIHEVAFQVAAEITGYLKVRKLEEELREMRARQATAPGADDDAEHLGDRIASLEERLARARKVDE